MLTISDEEIKNIEYTQNAILKLIYSNFPAPTQKEFDFLLLALSSALAMIIKSYLKPGSIEDFFTTLQDQARVFINDETIQYKYTPSEHITH